MLILAALRGRKVKIMTERTLRKKLAKMGYRLSSRTTTIFVDPSTKEPVKVKRYAIVDENNFLIAGEYTMFLKDVENWVKE